jgi:hypothetical protein
MPDAKQETKKHLTPVGRLINHALFVKDQFDENTTAKYSIELAFPNDDTLQEIEDALAAAAVAKWGAGAADQYWDGAIISPIIDGNVLAQRREEKGKPGDAYKDQLIIRAKTIYNKHGADGPGGIQVFNPDGVEIDPTMAAEVYQGSYGKAVLTIGTYTDSRTSKNALMFYLAAYGKDRDGERLVSTADHSEMFKPVGRAETGSTRRKRAG